MKRFYITHYNHHRIFWLVRFNIAVFKDMRTVEVSCGLFGYGVLAQLRYGEDRMK